MYGSGGWPCASASAAPPAEPAASLALPAPPMPRRVLHNLSRHLAAVPAAQPVQSFDAGEPLALTEPAGPQPH
jgi:hypothetical protein